MQLVVLDSLVLKVKLETGVTKDKQEHLEIQVVKVNRGSKVLLVTEVRLDQLVNQVLQEILEHLEPPEIRVLLVLPVSLVKMDSLVELELQV